jgi:carboxypeptidase T
LESTAISGFLGRNKNIKAAIDLHQYGQIILRPYGHTTASPPDEARNERIGTKMQTAIRGVNGRSYRSVRAIQFWSAAGIASDTFYGTHKLIGFTIEMRPPTASFHIPTSEILPNAKENFAAIMVLVNEVANL